MDIDWSEHYIRKGNPNAPTFYIIRRYYMDVGLFSNYIVFAGHIKYALTHGYIPVIDLQNYPNAHLPPHLLGKENAWEYYFEQPFRVTVEEAYKGENILLSEGTGIEDRPDTNMNFFRNKNHVLDEWRMLVKLGMLKIKQNLQEEISAVWEKLFSSEDRVLGVLLRGTDYTARKPYAHPIPPPPGICHE